MAGKSKKMLWLSSAHFFSVFDDVKIETTYST